MSFIKSDVAVIFFQYINILSNCIKYKIITLFQMVASLTRGKDSMTALNVILVMIGNKRSLGVDAFGEERICSTCTENNATKKCSRCKTMQYCDRECQRIHWFVHKKECGREVDNNEILQSSVDSSHVAQSLSDLGIK